MSDDARQAAERYRLDRELRDAGLEPAPAEPTGPARGSTAAERAAFVETSIQQAIRRGEFDDLPGAGKPLDLGSSHDPDWWIRRKIETEQLTGLGPPALTLRVEHAEMDERLDAIAREPDVREAVEDFNRRVIEARRQLQGGPPVVTPTVDVDAVVAAWNDRRRTREEAAAVAAPPPRRRWFRRGR
ncbi:DUF1992 domain-containing protein [Microbacterium sp. KSW4-17]|uniref:DUF1992 domain-containing protein n=1 Tax=Microbacterium galbum TaxID=3075994 RepID=A0ABU3T9E4_9MICO|nr:DUF1992 domain-containing protein [Microbacterium sp. KSW4-17]MDU0368001.1 DUF1992 domain-containing protein [Microbacterium sp. KSW4-17]